MRYFSKPGTRHDRTPGCEKLRRRPTRVLGEQIKSLFGCGEEPIRSVWIVPGDAQPDFPEVAPDGRLYNQVHPR